MYAVETRNAFELLEGGSARRAPAKKKATPSAAPAAGSEARRPRKAAQQSGGKSAAVRGGKRKDDGGRGGGQNRPDRRPRKDRKEGEGGGRPRKREFDRQSGTGRQGKEKKRGGGGKGTWGKPGSELEVLSEEVEKVQDQQPANGAADGAAAENDSEVEPPTIGLDEFEKSRQSKAAKLGQPKTVRKVEAKFDNAVKLSREEDAGVFSGQKKKKTKRKGGKADGSVPADKVFQLDFADESERGRGRGGRGRREGGGRDGGGRDGGGRGGGGRGEGGRDARKEKRGGGGGAKEKRGGGGGGGGGKGRQGKRVDLSDAAAFPSLGGK